MRALIGLAAGVFVWNDLRQILSIIGPWATMDLVIITVISAMVALLVYRALGRGHRRTGTTTAPH